MNACHYCGTTESERRPYGPGGASICFSCMKASPERETAAIGAFGALLDAAEVDWLEHRCPTDALREAVRIVRDLAAHYDFGVCDICGMGDEHDEGCMAGRAVEWVKANPE